MLIFGFICLVVAALLTPAWIASGHFFSVVGAACFQIYGQGLVFLFIWFKGVKR